MLELQPIERRTGLQSEAFAAEFLEPRIPVVLTDLMDEWPARQKWTIDYFKSKYGQLRVPVVSNNYSKPGKGLNRLIGPSWRKLKERMAKRRAESIL